MYVPAFQVFAFNFVKKPIISALWYAVLAHLLLKPFSTTAILISSALLAISFFSIRFYMAIASFIPAIASVILSYLNYPDAFIYILITACIWLVLCAVALVVTVRNAKGIYSIDPNTGVMYRR